MDNGWRQQWLAMHFGDDLEINDFGFLSRNNLNYAHCEVQRSASPTCRRSRATASHDWRWRISGTDNDHGLDLQRQFRMSRQSQLRDGGNEYAQVNVNAPGTTTASLRGNGIRAHCRRTSTLRRAQPAAQGRLGFYGELRRSTTSGIGDDARSSA